MSKPSPEYLAKVETCYSHDITIDRANMTTAQKFRTRLVIEAYQFWLNDKDIRPLQLMIRLAENDYTLMLHKAEQGDEVAQMYVRDLNIRAGVPRSVYEISNDVYVLNWFISRYTPDTKAIDKARDKEAVTWAIIESKKRGDTGSVLKGAQLSMALNGNYEEKENAYDQMPNMNITVTGDISVIRSGDSNYTDEEKKRLSKKFGLSEKAIQEFKENENGIMEAADDEEETDIFMNDEEDS